MVRAPVLRGPSGHSPTSRSEGRCRTRWPRRRTSRPAVGPLRAQPKPRDRRGDPLVGRGEGDPHVPGARAAVEVARRHQDAPLGQPGDGLPAASRRRRRRPRGRATPPSGRCGSRPTPGPRAAPYAGRRSARAAPSRARCRRARRPSRPAGGRASSGRGSCGPRAARRPGGRRRRRTRSGSRPGWSASTASGRRAARRWSRRRRTGAAPRPARPPRRTRGSTRRRPGRCRARGTSRRPCAGARAAAPGRSGSTASSARAARAARGPARSASRSRPRGRRPARRRPRRSGRPARGRRPGRRRRGRGGPRSEAISSFEPITGSTWSRPSPVTPCEPASQSRQACRVDAQADRDRVAGRVRGRAQRVLHDLGVGSTGVPTDRSTMPSGCARARSAWPVSLSQGKSGSREETVSVAHSSCSCGGSAATSAWSLSISPILAAPPGEPRSSKKWTLAS